MVYSTSAEQGIDWRILDANYHLGDIITTSSVIGGVGIAYSGNGTGRSYSVYSGAIVMTNRSFYA
jgi:hypothetical protein